MEDLTGKKVEVNTMDTLYTGILVEIGESEVHIKSETGWIVIPVDRIVEIKAAG